MIQEKPYFMKNEEWYYYDYNELIYKLTDKAPAMAIVSYNKFYEIIYDNLNE